MEQKVPLSRQSGILPLSRHPQHAEQGYSGASHFGTRQMEGLIREPVVPISEMEDGHDTGEVMRVRSVRCEGMVGIADPGALTPR